MRPLILPLAVDPNHAKLLHLLEASQGMRTSRLWRVWKKNGAPRQVVRWVRYGYKLPFKSHPVGWNKPNPPPASPEEAAARPAMWSKLIANGTLLYAAPANSQPKFLSPVRGEAKKEAGKLTGEFRVIQDLRALNVHLADRPVRYETCAHLPTMARSTDVAVCRDFKSFFYSFLLHPEDRHYTACRAPPQPHPATVGVDASGHPVDINGLPTYVPSGIYHNSALPMGMKLSPFVVAKLTRWIQAWIRRHHCNCLFYVDDVLLFGPSAAVRHLTPLFISLMDRLGLILHPSKGWLDPRHRFVFLGLGVDFQLRQFFIPDYKLASLAEKTKRTLQHARSHRNAVPVRSLASLVGMAASLQLASPILPLFLRSLHDVITTRHRWSSPVFLSTQALLDLRNLQTLSALYTSAPFRAPRTASVIYTDASTRGYGGWGSTPAGALVEVSGLWEDSHWCGEINVLELEAVLLFLRANRSQLHGQHVHLRSDNSSVIAVVTRHSSRSAAMMLGYRQLYAELLRNRVTLTARHIGTTANVIADDLSRAQDPTEFGVSVELRLRAEQQLHLQCQVDRFASALHHQPLPFETRYGCLEAHRVDTFTGVWTLPSWLTPPLALLVDVLIKLESDKARALLLAPVWPAALWYPLLALAKQSMPVPHLATHLTRHPNNRSPPEYLRNPAWNFRIYLIDGSAA